MIRLPIGHRLFLALATLAALLATVPARLAFGVAGLDGAGLSARETEGSLWAGRLVEPRFVGLPLGDLDFRTGILPLLVGRVRTTLDRASDSDPFHARITVARRLTAIDEASGRVVLAGKLAPLPIASIELDGVSGRFEDGLCAAASGRVRAQVDGRLGGIDLPAGLAGELRCEGGGLLLPLASQAGTEGLTLRLAADGRYRAELRLGVVDPAARDRLAASGFRADGGGYRIDVEGRW